MVEGGYAGKDFKYQACSRLAVRIQGVVHPTPDDAATQVLVTKSVDRRIGGRRQMFRDVVGHERCSFSVFKQRGVQHDRVRW